MKQLSWLLLYRVVNLLAPLGITWLSLLSYGAEEYGEFVYYISISAILSLGVKLSFEWNGLRQFKDKSDIEKSKLQSEFLGNQLILFLLIIVCLVVISPVLNLRIEYLLLTMVYVLRDLFISEYYLISMNEEKQLFFSMIFIRTVQFLLLIIFSAYMSIFYALTIPILLTSIFIIVINKLSLKFRYNKCIEYLKSSKTLVLSKGIILIKDNLPIIIIEHFLGGQSVTIYDIFKKIITASSVPISVINSKFLSNSIKLSNRFSWAIISLPSLFMILLSLLYFSLNIDLLSFDILPNMWVALCFSSLFLNSSSYLAIKYMISNRLDSVFLRLNLLTLMYTIIVLSLISYKEDADISSYLLVVTSIYLIELIPRVVYVRRSFFISR